MPDNQDKSSVTARGGSSPVNSQLDAFLAEIRGHTTAPAGAHGRLVFALDATASRQNTWDAACQLQAEMFHEVAATGGLDMQLVYYRGLGECRASRWISDPKQLAKTMSQIMCHAGETQIEKILIHAKKETKLLQVSALVFVGDAMEENPDTLAHKAGKLGRLRVPVFMFHEGHNREVEHTFQNIARLTHGAYCRFDKGSARQLGDLLKAVAAFATGGMPALATQHNASAIKLLGQLEGQPPGGRRA
jgi:hypothetical protein